jgi:hypothetical protein
VREETSRGEVSYVRRDNFQSAPMAARSEERRRVGGSGGCGFNGEGKAREEKLKMKKESAMERKNDPPENNTQLGY